MTVGSYIERETVRRKRRIRVGLVGFGITSRAVLCKIQGICDVSVRSHTAVTLPTGCVGIFGEGYLDDIFEDVLLLSPSVRRDSPWLSEARARGTVISSECEVFFSDMPDGRKIFAVTGSDGKTTVTNMASEMLSCAAVGNIGIPYSACEGERLYACELSSFNLYGFKPRSTAAVITSLSPNHLNWHTDLSEYYTAKLGIFEHTERRVMYAGGDCLPFADRADTLFSSEMSRNELLALGAKNTVYIDRGTVFYNSEPIICVRELSLTERHNILNFMAAVGLCHGYAGLEKIREVGKGFRAPRHRCERVHTSKNGTVFINSSIDTTPARTATTLLGLNQSVCLILGGRGKGLSPMPLKEPILKYARAIIAYGDFGLELCDFLKNDSDTATIPVIFSERLSDGLENLKSVISEGATVVLSPAATSYGEFESYEKRGDFFTEEVKRLFP